MPIMKLFILIEVLIIYQISEIFCEKLDFKPLILGPSQMKFCALYSIFCCC